MEKLLHNMDKLEILIEQTNDEQERDASRTQLAKMKLQMIELSKGNRPAFDLWPDSPLADPWVKGLVIDEVSMVDERLGTDLLSYGKKLLVLGDPFQLPPVGGGGFFTNQEPDVMLTEVHRQARESGILRLATKVREGGVMTAADSSEDVLVMPIDGRRQDKVMERARSADQLICGRNATRHRLNTRMRELDGLAAMSPIQQGERLVCLRNSRDHGMLNGQQYDVLHASQDDKLVDLLLRDSDDERGPEISVTSWTHHFYSREHHLKAMGPRKRDFMELDFAYALTCHKAQGSQWKSVCVIDEGSQMPDPSQAPRWRYTAITRASAKLTVVL